MSKKINQDVDNVIEYLETLSKEELPSLVEKYLGPWAKEIAYNAFSEKELENLLFKHMSLNTPIYMRTLFSKYPLLKHFTKKVRIPMRILDKGEAKIVTKTVKAYPLYSLLHYMCYKGYLVISVPPKEISKELFVTQLNKIARRLKEINDEFDIDKLINYIINSCCLKITDKDEVCIILDRATSDNLSTSMLDYLTKEELSEMMTLLSNVFSHINRLHPGTIESYTLRVIDNGIGIAYVPNLYTHMTNAKVWGLVFTFIMRLKAQLVSK